MNVRFERAFGRITLQDQGRPGQRHTGVPLGGPADIASAILANRLVGNPDLGPLLEFGLASATILFDENCVVAWTGAPTRIRLDDALIAVDRTVALTAGSRLTIEGFADGRYGYLAVGGAWDVGRWRGSVSPILLGAEVFPEGSVLRAGSQFHVVSQLTDLRISRPPKPPLEGGAVVIRYLPAPEVEAFEEWLHPAISGLKTIRAFGQTIFRVGTNSDRSGIRLRPAATVAELPLLPELHMRSSPTLLGTIQVLPQGHLIVNHVDGPTMGGYPRIGVVVTEDLGRLAQVRGEVRFQII